MENITTPGGSLEALAGWTMDPHPDRLESFLVHPGASMESTLASRSNHQHPGR